MTIASESLTRRAVERVRDLIVRGRLVPGSRVSEKDLCELLGISRTPLREALKMLATEGLIDLLPRRGARVARIDLERLKEQFAAVALIESDAARRLCRHGSDAAIRDLRVIHDALKSAYVSHDPGRYYHSNEQFHRAIVVLAGNATLGDIHAGLSVHLHRARHLVLSSSSVDGDFAHDHDDIIRAIERRAADAAAASVLHHQQAVAAGVVAGVASYDQGHRS